MKEVEDSKVDRTRLDFEIHTVKYKILQHKLVRRQIMKEDVHLSIDFESCKINLGKLDSSSKLEKDTLNIEVMEL